jgi:hypothetical protein
MTSSGFQTAAATQRPSGDPQYGDDAQTASAKAATVTMPIWECGFDRSYPASGHYADGFPVMIDMLTAVARKEPRESSRPRQLQFGLEGQGGGSAEKCNIDPYALPSCSHNNGDYAEDCLCGLPAPDLPDKRRSNKPTYASSREVGCSRI